MVSVHIDKRPAGRWATIRVRLPNAEGGSYPIRKRLKAKLVAIAKKHGLDPKRVRSQVRTGWPAPGIYAYLKVYPVNQPDLKLMSAVLKDVHMSVGLFRYEPSSAARARARGLSEWPIFTSSW